MTARGALATLPYGTPRRLGFSAAVLAGGVAIGALATVSPFLAVGALVGIAFVVVAFRNLAAGLAFFVVLTFFQTLPGSPSTGLTLVKAAGFVLALAWLAALANREPGTPLLFRDHPLIAYAAVFFLTWSLASMLWAQGSYDVRYNTGRLAQNVLLMFIAFTAISRRQHLFWVIGAYLGGALLTALVGLGGGSSSEQFGAFADPTRLSGGISDPNELAAILIPALVIGAFLIPVVASPLARLLLVVLVLVAAVTLFLTQSRGGLLALAVVLVITPFLAGPVRLRAVVVILMVGALGIGYYALVAPPAALSHVTHFSVGSGTGREDLWKVAYSMWRDHPLAGIGTGNFELVEPKYALRNIDLPRVDLVVENPKVAHNTYLHVLTELGVVGILAFGGMIVGSLAVAWRAIREFSRRRELRLEIVSRGVVIGTIGMLAAYVFITAQYQKQLWLLLGVCLALSTLARAGETADS
jgi:O-antigen ligase